MKIYIWGTGRLVGMVVGKYIDLKRIEGFVDNDETKKEYLSKKVVSPAKLRDLEYDVVLVVTLFSKEIYAQSIELGLDLSKFIFCYANCEIKDMNKDYGFIEKAVGSELADIIKKRYHIVRGVEAFGNLCFKDSKYEGKGYLDTDYVRMSCFELAVKEIRKRGLCGAVAEVGVFRGEFAQYINFAFPDRKCYLFDTFEGFDAEEALQEVRNGNCTEGFVEAYKHTSAKVVLDKMTSLENIIIKQGYFPETVGALEEEFVFVSLDVDFESSIYEGLKYFYPRLVKGGYLYIHDYNSNLLGVEAAVDRYEVDYDVMLCKVPVCDKSGTLIITK